jgi:acetyl/propionyl-CoA carboxylase alpha subunit
MSKGFHRVFIANRGEIAIRIARAARELGISSVGVHADDDGDSLHLQHVDRAVALGRGGARAYLDAAHIVSLAVDAGCDALHPGYGFLSESAELARIAAARGVCFVGPRPEALELFGDKLRARAFASELRVPVPRGTALRSLQDAESFFDSLAGASVIIKAVSGGGGRGMRLVRRRDELAEALKRASSEAEAAFGNGEVYAEELIEGARHVEVQVVGDAQGAVSHLYERECSLQRRHQKLVEIAPSPSLSTEERHTLCTHATRLAAAVAYQSLGTFEFLVGPRGPVFIEANPRLQVEHTVTETVLGIDLVQAQLRIAAGASLAELGLQQADVPAPRGYAIELRINAEELSADGEVRPTQGTVTRYDLPQGPFVRVDGAGFVGYAPSPGYDTLLAKLIVHAPQGGYQAALKRAQRALGECNVEGIATNLALLKRIVEDSAVRDNRVHTAYLEGALPRLLEGLSQTSVVEASHDGSVIAAPMFGRVLSVLVEPGDSVQAGQEVAVLEAMKMESAVLAERAGRVLSVCVKPGATVRDGAPILILEPGEAEASATSAVTAERVGPRADLAELAALKAALTDAARPDAVERRRKTGQRTARENVEDLCDPGSFLEYGSLAIAAQRNRRSLEELRKVSPADGFVAGLATVNAALFGPDKARAMVMSYDYTVFAGTQGAINHKKQDRLFKLAEEWAIPVVLFAEGGGGRPGDTDLATRSMLDLDTFAAFARLSGRVPTVGVVSGRCFAGNAALLGCADVIIATENANIGMGGPVMIEGAGLGSFPPEAIGPIDVQSQNGVVDVRVADEAEAVAVSKRYLGYFQGTLATAEHDDPAQLRELVPENRKRVYDVRRLIHTLFDADSVLELRREFGRGMVTALVRIGGRAVGVLANDPAVLAGAVDGDAADKAARFMRLCNAHRLPLVALVDTPGFMVGPTAEQTALVRRVSRMLVTAAHLSVPYFTIVLRKAYGLGAMAMSAGSLHASVFSVAWPTGEFGAMGLEGAVWLAARKDLEKIDDPAERERVLRGMADVLREQGRATNIASHLEIDDVIDPADSRAWLLRGLASVPSEKPSRGPVAFIDTW